MATVWCTKVMIYTCLPELVPNLTVLTPLKDPPSRDSPSARSSTTKRLTGIGWRYTCMYTHIMCAMIHVQVGMYWGHGCPALALCTGHVQTLMYYDTWPYNIISVNYAQNTWYMRVPVRLDGLVRMRALLKRKTWSFCKYSPILHVKMAWHMCMHVQTDLHELIWIILNLIGMPHIPKKFARNT